MTKAPWMFSGGFPDEQKPQETYGLFVHRGDGKYKKSDALKVYKRESDAEKEARKRYDAGSPVVVRSMRLLPD